MDRAIIEQLEPAVDRLKAAVAGLSREDLLAFPVPGTWSIQQIVIHVADSDLIIGDRIRRMIAEDRPLLMNADENLWIKNLFPEEQLIDDALALMKVHRRQLARVLRKLPDAAFDRVGIHSARGVVSVGWFVEALNTHLDHHVKFIDQKRKLLGKPILGKPRS
jgi:hypothetical protein